MDKFLDKKEILNSIDLPDKLDKLIQDSVDIGYARIQTRKRFRKKLYLKRAAAIIGILFAGGIAAVPVRAYVLSVVQARMEQVSQEEAENILAAVDEAEAESDTYSRNYTDTEKEKLKSLNKAYQQGTFPREELRQETTKNTSLADVVYFAQDTSTFCLPERELTDEELLELIDFQAKRDYMLAERYKTADGAERQEEQIKAKEAVLDEGGITEEEAVVRGREWLGKLYGVSCEGMELNHYLDDESFLSEEPVYNVNFSIRSQEYYYFWLDAQSGELISAMASFAEELETGAVSRESLEQKTDLLCREAEKILNRLLGTAPEYERVVMGYLNRGGNIENCVNVFFVSQDGSAYEIDVKADSGEFRNYWFRQNFEEYRKETEEALKSIGNVEQDGNNERVWIFTDISVNGGYE